MIYCDVFVGAFAGGKTSSMSNLSQVSDSHYKMKVPYIPDFSVRIIAETQFIKIHRAHYIAAVRATNMARRNGGGSPGAEATLPVDVAFQKEWSRAISISTADNSPPRSRNTSGGSHAPSGGFDASEHQPLSPIQRSDEDEDGDASSTSVDREPGPNRV